MVVIVISVVVKVGGVIEMVRVKLAAGGIEEVVVLFEIEDVLGFAVFFPSAFAVSSSYSTPYLVKHGIKIVTFIEA